MDNKSAYRRFLLGAVILAGVSLGCVVLGIDIAATRHFREWVETFGSLWLDHRFDRNHLAECFIWAGIFCGAAAIGLFNKAMYYSSRN